MKILLHASAVKTADDKAVIFFGPSGAGKSTAAEVFGGPDGIIADDKIFLWFTKDGLVWVADAEEAYRDVPYDEADPSALTWHEIAAVCRLNKAAGEPFLLELIPDDVVNLMTQAYFDFWWNHNVPEKEKFCIVVQLAKAAKTIPGYNLFFSVVKVKQ